MRRLVIALVLIGSILGALAIVEWRGVAVSAAQAITPAPGRHSEVRAAFAFLVKDAPNQMGWRSAEYKNEYGQAFYKTDVAPGCGEWQTVGGDARPGLLLTPGGATCAGFRIDFGALYWFSAPPIVVTASPLPPPPTATVTPGATATPSPTVASGATATPSPQGEATPTRTVTRSLPGSLPGPFSGQLSINGMCTLGGEIAYLYNIRRDAAGKITSFDKLICTTRAELRAIQNFDAIATLDARVPITTAWWLLSTPTPQGLGR